MKRPIINFNQEWTEASDDLLHALSPGVIRGHGVFETILIDHGHVCLWQEHFDRLKRGCGLYKIQFTFSSIKLLQQIKKIVQLNHLIHGRVRISIYKDQGQIFFNIVGVPLNSKKDSIKVMISPIRRKKNAFSHVKSITYEPYFEANKEAKSKGYDEAILLNPSGFLVEGSTTNIFMVEKNLLLTPSIDTGCLNGIIRQKVIGLARQAGIKVKTGKYKLNRLVKADEVFLTNSLIGLKPVSCVNQFRFLKKPRPVFDLLLDLYKKSPQY
ncbi:MAG: aminotransferase class IV family protein [Candidatus Omnitrophica bacterium]|nr:aminotransferase class IV family protein [Candidatus Omnitrophota bacterium]